MNLAARARGRGRAAGRLACLLWLVSLCLPIGARAQDSDEEVVANLASGRVVILVARDAILIAAIEQKSEAESIAPRVIPMSGRRVGVLLGAAEWLLPGSGQGPVRLDRDAPRIGSEVSRIPESRGEEQATDIEVIGVSFLERLRGLAGQLHHKISLGPDEPMLELLIAGYVADYGPEVWLLKYRVQQEALRAEYYQTRVLRPSYEQLYPPEKHRPRTLVEVRYPEDLPGPKVLEFLQGNEAPFPRLRDADPKIARVMNDLQRGKSQESRAEDAVNFLRASLNPIAGKSQLILGVIYEEKGFDWVLPPAEPLEKAKDDRNRPPDKPTLYKKP